MPPEQEAREEEKKEQKLNTTQHNTATATTTSFCHFAVKCPLTHNIALTRNFNCFYFYFFGFFHSRFSSTFMLSSINAMSFAFSLYLSQLSAYGVCLCHCFVLCCVVLCVCVFLSLFLIPAFCIECFGVGLFIIPLKPKGLLLFLNWVLLLQVALTAYSSFHNTVFFYIYNSYYFFPVFPLSSSALS